MKYLEYQELKQRGTFDFPIDFYHVEKSHPRYEMPYHWHPECEIIHIIKGSFLLTVDNTLYPLKEGSLLFIQDGMLHGGIPEDCVYECLVFDLKLLLKNSRVCRSQLESILNHQILISRLIPLDDNALSQAAQSLFSAMREKYSGYELTVLGSFYLLFGTILQKKLYTLRSEHEQHITYRLKQIKQVLQYIEEHYTEEITLGDMASIAGMNPKYFCRFFRQITQRTPVNYLNYYRIECAREQLSTTDATITEVALNCGFNDISYFIKTFKKQLGVTPKQYTRQLYS